MKLLNYHTSLFREHSLVLLIPYLYLNSKVNFFSLFVSASLSALVVIVKTEMPVCNLCTEFNSTVLHHHRLIAIGDIAYEREKNVRLSSCVLFNELRMSCLPSVRYNCTLEKYNYMYYNSTIIFFAQLQYFIL